MTGLREAVERLHQIRRALNGLERTDPMAVAKTMSPHLLVDAVALIQEFKRRLDDIETTFAAEVGRGEGKHVGNLSDGRQYEIKRSADRKAWDHEDWKRDVRRAITRQVVTDAAGEADLVVVDPATGQESPLGPIIQAALAMAQEVHGSTAPRSGALKQLDLWASDYSTSTPGPWRLAVAAAKRRASWKVLQVRGDLRAEQDPQAP